MYLYFFVFFNKVVNSIYFNKRIEIFFSIFGIFKERRFCFVLLSRFFSFLMKFFLKSIMINNGVILIVIMLKGIV